MCHCESLSRIATSILFKESNFRKYFIAGTDTKDIHYVSSKEELENYLREALLASLVVDGENKTVLRHMVLRETTDEAQ